MQSGQHAFQAAHALLYATEPSYEPALPRHDNANSGDGAGEEPVTVTSTASRSVSMVSSGVAVKCTGHCMAAAPFVPINLQQPAFRRDPVAAREAGKPDVYEPAPRTARDDVICRGSDVGGHWTDNPRPAGERIPPRRT